MSTSCISGEILPISKIKNVVVIIDYVLLYIFHIALVGQSCIYHISYLAQMLPNITKLFIIVKLFTCFTMFSIVASYTLTRVPSRLINTGSFILTRAVLAFINVCNKTNKFSLMLILQ
jgi:hypothetical protein